MALHLMLEVNVALEVSWVNGLLATVEATISSRLMLQLILQLRN